MDKTTLSFQPQGVGKYKTAKAYVRLDSGEGHFIINGEPARAYFAENSGWRKALDPFKAAGLDEGIFDIQARVVGCAKSWSKRQPRALAHAIAGALTALDTARRDQLWQAGFRFKAVSGLDSLQKLSVEAWLALWVDPDELWAKHHALFLGPVPKEWVDNPHVLTFGGRWLLDVLLVPLDDDDLNRVRDHLSEQGQALCDVDILRELFDITSRDDAFDRWRFTLSYRLNREAKVLGVEFVGFDVVIGSDVVWSWALQKAPFEKPERHRRLPGTEGLPIEYVEVDEVATELTRDDEPLEVPPPEEPQQDWKPTRQTWEYVLTYYHWDNGVLPYNRQAREMIPPLSEGQRRAILYFVAEQVDDEPFEVVLCTDSGKTWLQSMGLKDLFAGYCRVPGARIWIDRTEELGLYKIRYRPTEPRHRRLLFFEEGRVRPVIREREIICEVDETMLLAEGRYSNIEALDRLDLADRRTAPKVLARVFELIGLKDESRDVYCACFDDLFPLLSITKPYSRDYVNQILYDRKNYPWFYSDEERETGWFVYDPEKKRKVITGTQPPSTDDGSEEAVDTTAPISDLWTELEADRRRKAALQAAVKTYMTDPARENVLFLREVAHQRIRELVAEDQLDTLTLDEFNRQIWRIGSFKYQGHICRIDSEEADALLRTMSVEELHAAYRSGALEIEGNQTWGSGSHELGPQLGKSDTEKEQLVRATLRLLLSGEGSIEQRMKQVISEPNGFGMNVVSGILHAVYPAEHILYNRRSVDALKMLEISWPGNWPRNVGMYVAYRNLCQRLKEYSEFQNLTDVDWFMYSVATGQTRMELEVEEETTAFLLGLTLGKGEINRSSNTVRITLQYGHYKDGRITGGGVAFDEREALPKGAEQVYARLKPLSIDYESLTSVNLRQRSLYRYELILEFITDQHGLLDTILAWYPTGSSNADFDFPTAQLESAPIEIAKAFMQGYACATGLLTDTTRAGPAGRHRVFIRAATANREILNNVRWLLEQRLNVPVAHIHWHEGRDPQLRVYAEDFEKIGFGLYWEDQILTACARENREGSPTSSQNQPRLFNNLGNFHSD